MLPLASKFVVDVKLLYDTVSDRLYVFPFPFQSTLSPVSTLTVIIFSVLSLTVVTHVSPSSVEYDTCSTYVLSTAAGIVSVKLPSASAVKHK